VPLCLCGEILFTGLLAINRLSQAHQARP
jgi:hypothetical protein